MHKAHISVLWKIENFSMKGFENDKSCSSSTFNLHTLQLTKWKLKMSSDVECLKVFLCRCSDGAGPEIVSLSYSLFVVGAESSIMVLVAKDRPFEIGRTIAGFIRHDVLTENRKTYLARDVLKVKCDIEYETAQSILPLSFFATSEIVTKRFRTKWPINFQSTLSQSPYFSFESEYCFARIFCEGDESDEHWTASMEGTAEIALCEMYLLTPEGHRASVTPDLVLKRGILAPELNRVSVPYIKENGLVVNGIVLLDCEFQLSNGEVRQSISECDPSPASRSSDHIQSFREDMHCLYKETSLCDFSIRLRSGKVFKVHSVVLAARSPVLKAMVENDMTEWNSKSADIIDIDDDVMEQFVHYLYTDEMDVVDMEAVRKLYSTAAKYQVKGLKEKCFDCLTSNMTPDSVCKVLELADMYEDLEMKSAVQYFIENNRNAVLLSDKWKDFSHLNSVLVIEVLTALALKPST